MGVKIAVVGGGSTYTPELVEGFARRPRPAPDRRAGPARHRPERLEVVGGLARRMLDTAAAGAAGSSLTGDREAAIDGADFVLDPAPRRRAGGAPRRRDAAADVRRRRPGDDRRRRVRQGPADRPAGPRARRAGRPARRARGLDRGLHQPGRDRHPGAARRRATGRSGCATSRSGSSGAWPSTSGWSPSGSQLEHVGLNHLSWERAVRVDGVDRLPELLDAATPRCWPSSSACPPSSSGPLGAIPSYYLRYYYETARGLEEQRGGHTRAEDVIDIEAQLLELYRDPTLTEKPALLDRPGGAFYSEAAAQLIASLHDGRGRLQVVDVRTTARSPTCPTRPSSRSRPGSTVTGPTRCRSLRSRRRCAALSRRSRHTRSWPSRRPSAATGGPRSGRCRQSARPAGTSPSRSSTRCSRPTGRTCRGSSGLTRLRSRASRVRFRPAAPPPAPARRSRRA